MKYPLSDDYMIYNFKMHRYIPTQKCVLDELGIDLKQRLNLRRANNADNMMKLYLNQASIEVYSFIYQYNLMKTQQYLLAKCPSARDIIKEAMKQQLLYILSVGNLSKSSDKEKKDLYLDKIAQQILKQEISEIGTSILYVGDFGIVPPSYEQGGY